MIKKFEDMKTLDNTSRNISCCCQFFDRSYAETITISKMGIIKSMQLIDSNSFWSATDTQNPKSRPHPPHAMPMFGPTERILDQNIPPQWQHARVSSDTRDDSYDPRDRVHDHPKHLFIHGAQNNQLCLVMSQSDHSSQRASGDSRRHTIDRRHAHRSTRTCSRNKCVFLNRRDKTKHVS